jgi:heptosyltransferase-2
LNKLLVVAPSWVGDAVISHSLIQRLKNVHPASQIDVLANPLVAEIYEAMTEINFVHINPFGHGELNLISRRAFAKKLIGPEKYDQAYVLPNSFKSALIPYFAGIQRRTGFIGEQRFIVLNDRRKLDKERLPLMVERYAFLANEETDKKKRPTLRPRFNEDEKIKEQTKNKYGISGENPIVCLCPGAEYGPAKQWPKEYFSTTARDLGEYNFSVIILGSKKDESIGKHIEKHGGKNIKNLCGSTSLREAMSIIGFCDLVITNDSGLMHISAAYDTPTIAIFGSSSTAFTPPLSEKAVVLEETMSCRPCFQRICPLDHTDCLNQIRPNLVTEKAITLIESYGIHVQTEHYG